eukprot:17703-Eustigmatos_ZCMA.PRE.1
MLYGWGEDFCFSATGRIAMPRTCRPTPDRVRAAALLVASQVLIATDVLAEGIDVPACRMVVTFEEINNP